MASFVHKRAFLRLLWIEMVVAAFALVLAQPAQTWPKESVRAELVRLQKETGLTLASYYRGLRFVSFQEGSFSEGKDLLPGGSGVGVVSRDGTEVALSYSFLGESPRQKRSVGIVREDGSNLREYRDIGIVSQLCWSGDKSKLAIFVEKAPDTALSILDANTGAIQQEGNVKALVTSQCWSVENRQIVFEANGSVMVYEVGKPVSDTRTLVEGKFPTWSPDGNWIAFLDHDTYYAVHPDGSGRKKLFHKYHAVSALWWSTDCRFVAYVSQAGWFEGGLSVDVETYLLRVRRLQDSSEDKVTLSSDGEIFQWVTNPEFRAAAGSDPADRQKHP